MNLFSNQSLWESSLLWIVLLPLLGAVVNGLFGRFASKQLVGAIAVGSVGLGFLFALGSFLFLVFQDTGSLEYHVYDWFRIALQGENYQTVYEPVVSVAFRMDSLSSIMTLVVTGIGLLIHIYSLGYMEEDKSYARFFCYLNLFTASMLILVLADNFPLLFVGWEGVGLCSYLLIGFWWDNPAYAAAGRKAFVVNRIGDFGVLIGMFLLVMATGSFEFEAINAQAATRLHGNFTLGGLIPNSEVTIATAACLFLFLGCTGKSAQIPLFVWLPDAMAGPTPVSALIHAATMVTAGVYLCCRLSDVFLQSTTALAVIAIVGACTALLAASIALVQNEIKKILAYSTVSQLGFMFAAVGCGAFIAGFFHVYTHAFFKACLFLGAGAVMHAVGAHGDADIRKLGGLRAHLPITWITFLVSCLAIAGVPLFSGFFSKDEILAGAIRFTAEMPIVGYLVYGMLVLSAIMTAFYMFRLYFVTFHGEYRSARAAHDHGAHASHDHDHDDDHAHGYAAHPHKPPLRMAVPLIVLGVGAVFAGYVSVGLLHFDPWGQWLESAVSGYVVTGPDAEAMTGFAHNLALAGGSLAMAIGIGLAYVFYVQQKRVPGEVPQYGLLRVLYNKWYVDELYNATVVRLMKEAARLSGFLDKTFVDGILARLTAITVKVFGFLSTRIQTGVVYVYGAVMLIGVLAIGGWFLYPHASIEAAITRTTVDLEAGRGLGYQYRWNLDADDDWEVETPSVRGHEFKPTDYIQTVVRIERAGHVDEVVLEAQPESIFSIPPHRLGKNWSQGAGRTPPALRLHEGVPLLVRNDARRLTYDDLETEEEAVALEYGKVAKIGDAEITVQRRARLALIMQLARQGPDIVEEVVQVPGSGEDPRILTQDFGPDWWNLRRDDEGNVVDYAPVEPTVHHEDGHVVVRYNDARRPPGVEEDVARFGPGEIFSVGLTQILVGVNVDITLDVENAFGNRTQQTHELLLRPRAEGAAEQRAALTMGGER